MKFKKIFYLFLLLACLGFTLTACNNDSSSGEDEPSEEIQEPSEVVIDKKYLESLVFEDKTVDYNGKKQYVEVQDVPEGVYVKYENNGKTKPGEYIVFATIKYNGIEVSKRATLKINKVQGEITALENQTAFIYGGDVYPKFEVNNTEQKVSYKVFKDGVEVDVLALCTPGTYTIKVTAEETSGYYAASTTINMTIVESLYGLSFEDQVIAYDGNEHEITLNGELPSGFSVEYSNNKGTQAGRYYAIANVKNASGEVVETHAATLTIEYPENAEFTTYLDEFFVEYLEGDQLSVNIFCENPADYGLSRYDAVWLTYEPSTEEEITEAVEYFNELLTELKAFENAQLSPLQQVAYNKVETFLLENLDLYKFDDIEYMRIVYVDQFGGYVADFATYMEAYSLRSEDDIKDVISYINSTATAFPSYLELVDDKIEAGYALSDFTITKMREFLKKIIDDGADYYLADAIGARIDAVSFLSNEEKSNYKSQVENAMDNVYIPAVKTLYDGLESRMGNLAKEDEGYWAKYDNGKELYVKELESLLGLNNFDIEAYIKEVESALRGANGIVTMKQSPIVSKYGVKTYDDLLEVLSRFKIFEGTPDEMMVYLKEFAPTIVPNLNSEPDINIKYMDPASASVSNAVAYYMKSALDNSKGENITLNGTKLGDANDVLGTLAHEGYPGHLYAYVYSKEIGQHHLSTIMTSTAHAEGWATYIELKLYDYAMSKSNDPDFIQIMDYLKANHSAGFLLETRIDVGIHYEGWTVAQVGNFMDSLGYSADSAQEIYDLLIETPSSYAAYGYGKMMFTKLHEEAQEILGPYYNEVEFNGMLLSKGWTSLGELENTYIEYMRSKCHSLGLEFNK